jgi:hypothetical protein
MTKGNVQMKMRRFSVIRLFAIVALGTTFMCGQATRTWVSGVGDDANPCSRTAPCKTFAGAISKTAPGGEIDALDPGGFGALTITKSITLDGGGGQVASVLVSGTNGITVAAGVNDVVIIRNLRLDGLLGGGNANAGINGINFISGKDLNIENCIIFGFNTTGININLNQAATVHVVNTIIKNIGSCTTTCSNGVGDGIFATTSTGTVKVTVDNSQIMVVANNGINASQNSRVAVNRSLISAYGGSAGQSVGNGGAGSGSSLSFDNCELVYGNNGVTAINSSTAFVSHTTIAYNTGTAYNAITGATAGIVNAYTTGSNVIANGTNRVHDNGAPGNPTYISGN